ncbi:hypothetical protein QUC31_002248 [Theobroma cacao]
MLQSGFAEAAEEEETSTTSRSCIGGFGTESNATAASEFANVEAEPPSLDGSRCIAGEDLSGFGAGKEGWLAPDVSTTLLCALDAHSLAIANRSLILILGWSDPDEPRSRSIPNCHLSRPSTSRP